MLVFCFYHISIFEVVATLPCIKCTWSMEWQLDYDMVFIVLTAYLVAWNMRVRSLFVHAHHSLYPYHVFAQFIHLIYWLLDHMSALCAWVTLQYSGPNCAVWTSFWTFLLFLNYQSLNYQILASVHEITLWRQFELIYRRHTWTMWCKCAIGAIILHLSISFSTSLLLFQSIIQILEVSMLSITTT